ncbi:M16 family metallopeptidase [Kitasatospora sp. NPDC058063]|uniref:M16 family metallopeptidase n=1 Tax=unclassified Kitasatospora TaxID=2633591 RepID=UPI0036D7C4F2
MNVRSMPPVLAVVDERLTTTSLCLAVGYGARHDPSGLGGLAHLLEHALMSASVDGAASFTERVERLGGHANAETGMELMLFYARVHADDADEIAGDLLHAVLTPHWTVDGLWAERGVVLSELAAVEADHADVVQDRFLARLFAGHPLGLPVGGERGALEAFELPAVEEGHRSVFLASPMTLFVVGPRVPERLAAHAVRVPGHEPRLPAAAGAVPRPAQSPAPVEAYRGAPRWPAQYAWAAIGARSVPTEDPARHAYDLLGQLMGGAASSLLYRRLRNDRGLAYMFQSWNRCYRETGAWRVLVGVDEGSGPAVLETVREVLAELAATGPTEDDLAAARRQARMGLIVSCEEPLEFVRMIAQQTAAGTLAWSAQDELAALDAVTAEDVRRAAAAVSAELVAVVWPEA